MIKIKNMIVVDNIIIVAIDIVIIDIIDTEAKVSIILLIQFLEELFN